ncbi:MAG: hypothetical protein ACREQ4_13685 [Candidatus Binataceae bacterium]
MAFVKSRMTIPSELLAAVDAHCNAIVANDERVAEALVDAHARPAHRAAIARVAEMRPFTHAVTLARARVGFQYIVKVRISGSKGRLDLQNRWYETNSEWRIVEIEDLGVRSPWKKPDEAVNHA